MGRGGGVARGSSSKWATKVRWEGESLTRSTQDIWDSEEAHRERGPGEAGEGPCTQAACRRSS